MPPALLTEDREMRVITLATGAVRCIGVHDDAPKCLIKFGDQTLPEGHIENPQRHDITDLTLYLDYGDRPVKLCHHDCRIIALRNQLALDLEYNSCGGSFSILGLMAETAAGLANVTDTYIANDRREEPCEEAMPDLALARPDEFRVADVTGLPSIEIDFPKDIIRTNEHYH